MVPEVTHIRVGENIDVTVCGKRPGEAGPLRFVLNVRKSTCAECVEKRLAAFERLKARMRKTSAGREKQAAEDRAVAMLELGRHDKPRGGTL